MSGYACIGVEDIRSVLPYDCRLIAVDLVDGARNLVDGARPERAFSVFSAEDPTLSEKVLCSSYEAVYIPTSRCMNLAATVNVVLYDRIMKGGRTMSHDGGPVFPRVAVHHDFMPNDEIGMKVRAHYKAIAMQGLIQQPGMGMSNAELVAESADLADLQIAEDDTFDTS